MADSVRYYYEASGSGADRGTGTYYVPDAGHQLPAFTIRMTWNYFTPHLAGKEPPDYQMLPMPTGR